MKFKWWMAALTLLVTVAAPAAEVKVTNANGWTLHLVIDYSKIMQAKNEQDKNAKTPAQQCFDAIKNKLSQLKSNSFYHALDIEYETVLQYAYKYRATKGLWQSSRDIKKIQLGCSVQEYDRNRWVDEEHPWDIRREWIFLQSSDLNYKQAENMADWDTYLAKNSSTISNLEQKKTIYLFFVWKAPDQKRVDELNRTLLAKNNSYCKFVPLFEIVTDPNLGQVCNLVNVTTCVNKAFDEVSARLQPNTTDAFVTSSASDQRTNGYPGKYIFRLNSKDKQYITKVVWKVNDKIVGTREPDDRQISEWSKIEWPLGDGDNRVSAEVTFFNLGSVEPKLTVPVKKPVYKFSLTVDGKIYRSTEKKKIELEASQDVSATADYEGVEPPTEKGEVELWLEVEGKSKRFVSSLPVDEGRVVLCKKSADGGKGAEVAAIEFNVRKPVELVGVTGRGVEGNPKAGYVVKVPYRETGATLDFEFSRDCNISLGKGKSIRTTASRWNYRFPIGTHTVSFAGADKWRSVKVKVEQLPQEALAIKSVLAGNRPRPPRDDQYEHTLGKGQDSVLFKFDLSDKCRISVNGGSLRDEGTLFVEQFESGTHTVKFVAADGRALVRTIVVIKPKAQPLAFMRIEADGKSKSTLRSSITVSHARGKAEVEFVFVMNDECRIRVNGGALGDKGTLFTQSFAAGTHTVKFVAADGRELSRTIVVEKPAPLKLALKSITIANQSRDFTKTEHEVAVAKGTRAGFTCELTERCRMFMNGTPQKGEGTFCMGELPVGKHTVKFVTADGRELELTITVSEQIVPAPKELTLASVAADGRLMDAGKPGYEVVTARGKTRVKFVFVTSEECRIAVDGVSGKTGTAFERNFSARDKAYTVTFTVGDRTLTRQIKVVEPPKPILALRGVTADGRRMDAGKSGYEVSPANGRTQVKFVFVTSEECGIAVDGAPGKTGAEFERSFSARDKEYKVTFTAADGRSLTRYIKVNKLDIPGFEIVSVTAGGKKYSPDKSGNCTITLDAGKKTIEVAVNLSGDFAAVAEGKGKAVPKSGRSWKKPLAVGTHTVTFVDKYGQKATIKITVTVKTVPVPPPPVPPIPPKADTEVIPIPPPPPPPPDPVWPWILLGVLVVGGGIGALFLKKMLGSRIFYVNLAVGNEEYQELERPFGPGRYRIDDTVFEKCLGQFMIALALEKGDDDVLPKLTFEQLPHDWELAVGNKRHAVNNGTSEDFTIGIDEYTLITPKGMMKLKIRLKD